MCLSLSIVLQVLFCGIENGGLGYKKLQLY